MNKIRIHLPKDRITEFCRRWKIRKFSLFGPVLREDFRKDSDIDVLVYFETGTGWSLSDYIRMKDKLEEIFERKVDLPTRRAIEESPNYLRQKAILSSTEVVYVA